MATTAIEIRQDATAKANPPTEAVFLEAANGTARTRTMNGLDYRLFCSHLRKARRAARQGRSYFEDRDAGAVANAYRYPATTARWGVWVDPQTHDVCITVRRVSCNNSHATRAYSGGERQYNADWRKHNEKG